MSFQNRTVIITGAGSGIGAATARRFSQAGASVVLSGRRREPLEDLAAELGPNALPIAGDVSIPQDCEHVVETALEQFGSVDVLFNNAGVIFRERPVHLTSLEEWRQTFDVNVTGTFLMSRAVLPHMLARKRGSIVHNASCVGLAGGEEIAAYSAAKGAVVLLTRSMARDYAAAGVRINCVCPGSVDTPMLDKEMEEMGGADLIRPLFAARHPIGRIGAADEVAALVVFLASDDAAFITGASVPIDGGRLA